MLSGIVANLSGFDGLDPPDAPAGGVRLQGIARFAKVNWGLRLVGLQNSDGRREASRCPQILIIGNVRIAPAALCAWRGSSLTVLIAKMDTSGMFTAARSVRTSAGSSSKCRRDIGTRSPASRTARDTSWMMKCRRSSNPCNVAHRRYRKPLLTNFDVAQRCPSRTY